ncbi:MAG: universal stress protein [Acidimicrobiales bacterium]
MKILLAVDDDAASYEAALVVADWFDDETSVVALHVGSITLPASLTTPVVMGGLGYPIVSLPALKEERREVFRQAREIAENAAAVTDGSPRTEAGDPAEKIVDVAVEIDADLIVVGTGDRSWLSRVVSPSVSEEVIHHAPCPVLVVRPADTRRSEVS